MTFLGFHHVLLDVILGHIPYLSGSFRGGWFVQIVLIEDMSHCYDIFGLHPPLPPFLVREIIWSLLVCADSPY